MSSSISSRIEQQLHQSPHAPALTVYEEPAREPARLTYGDLLERVRELQNGLVAIRDGAPTILVMQPAASAVAALLALCALERAVVLVPPTLGLAEWDRVLHAARPASIIYGDADTPPVSHPESGHSTKLPFGLSYRHIASASAAHPVHSSLIQMTSGSTATFRLAVRSFEAVATEIDAVAPRLGLHARPGGRVLCASALSHSYGCVAGLLVPLTNGSECIVTTDPEALPEALAAQPPDILVGLESTYRRLLEREGAREDLREVRFALSAGAPLPARLYDRCFRILGIQVRQDYGTTETGTISIDAPGPPDPETVGLPLAHVTIRLAAPEDQPLREDEEGELLVLSRATAHAYLENGSLLPATDREGWYHTRDVGRLCPDGRLALGRRLRPLIQRGKHLIRADDIEDVIGRMSGVREVVVVPQPRPDGSDGIKAVVAASNISRRSVEEWCRRHLGREQIPDTIEIREELKRSPAGKVLQRYLVDAAPGAKTEG